MTDTWLWKPARAARCRDSRVDRCQSTAWRCVCQPPHSLTSNAPNHAANEPVVRPELQHIYVQQGITAGGV
jgi:hypothetical protein